MLCGVGLGLVSNIHFTKHLTVVVLVHLNTHMLLLTSHKDKIHRLGITHTFYILYGKDKGNLGYITLGCFVVLKLSWS
jgi:hypothetical protein